MSCGNIQLGTIGYVCVTVGPLAPVCHDNAIVTREGRNPVSGSYFYLISAAMYTEAPIAKLVVPWSQFSFG